MEQKNDQKKTQTVEQKEVKELPTRRKKISKIKEGISKLPDKKPHLDFIAAILTIPLLALTLYLNFSALKNKNAAMPSPTPVQNQMQNNTGQKQTAQVTR